MITLLHVSGILPVVTDKLKKQVNFSARNQQIENIFSHLKEMHAGNFFITLDSRISSWYSFQLVLWKRCMAEGTFGTNKEGKSIIYETIAWSDESKYSPTSRVWTVVAIVEKIKSSTDWEACVVRLKTCWRMKLSILHSRREQDILFELLLFQSISRVLKSPQNIRKSNAEFAALFKYVNNRISARS